MNDGKKLEDIRAEIDRADEQLEALFLKRMKLSADVAEYKIRRGLPTYRPEREKEILDRVSAQAPAGYAEYARRFFSSIMEISRDYQDKLREAESEHTEGK